MGDIGYRRKGDSGPLYNPERDYAYITPTLMRIAIERLDTDDSPEAIAWRQEAGITEQDVLAVVDCLANAQRDFVNAADPVRSFEAALTRHGFYDLRYPVRQFLFAAIGEVFCAAWFKAVREVSVVGEESPAQTDMARFTAAVREFIAKRTSTVFDANSVAERLRMMHDVSRAREASLEAGLRAKQAELLHCAEEIAKLKAAHEKKHGWRAIWARTPTD